MLALDLQRRLARQARRREVRRLKRHFARVICLLEERPTSGLDTEQIAARQRNVRELAGYALRGRFPKNRDFADRRMPYFIDAEGTRCAMAHLIESSGGGELVRDVAATRNNAFVRELVAEPGLVRWLRESGLSAEEAALIQPSYCSTYANECFCYASEPGVLEVLVQSVDGASFTGRVSAIHGTSAYALGADLSGLSSYFTPAVDDMLLVSESGYVVYRLVDADTVDTSSCATFMFGEPPATAPKDAVISNLLGQCGAGLDAQWTTPIGDCGPPSTAAVTTGAGPTSGATAAAGGTTAGGGTGGEGGAPAEDGDGDGDGCAAAPGARPLGGALFVASVLVAGALHLRTRRARR